MKNIANIITQILTYSDSVGTTDNPQMRNFDWQRRYSSISIDNPFHQELRIPPGEEVVLFDGLRQSNLDATSIVEISNIYGSVYKLTSTAGTSGGWRVARSITPLSDVNVTINNDAVATFEFVGATISGVMIGDTLRVSGECTYDVSPFSFSSVNSGLWRVIAVNGNKIQASRPTGEPFSGITESVVGTNSDQISVYSSSGVQKCDTFEIKGGFSSATYRSYKVKDVTPTSIYFVSTTPIPEESVTYPDPITEGESLVIYTSCKKIFYFESDQDVSVRFNDDSDDNVKVSPIQAGNPDLVGYLHKYGNSYKAVVKNKSVNTAKILYFVAE